MADVQYVTVTLSDGTPVQVVAGTPLHDLYLALAGFTTPASATSPDIDLSTLRPMAWFMTPHGPQSVVEPATITEFRRRDYAEITAQQAADFFANAVEIPDVSFITGQELPAAMAAAAADTDSAFSVAQRAALVRPSAIRVADYGTLGTADDSATIDAAVADANGRRLIFPPNATLYTSGNTLAGISNAVIDGNGCTLQLKAGSVGAAGLNVTGVCDNLEIRNLRVKGSAVVADAHVGIGAPSGSTLSDIRVINCRIEDVTLGISFSADGAGSLVGLVYQGNYLKNIVGTSSGTGYGLHWSISDTVNPSGVRCIGNTVISAQRHSIYCAKAQGTTILGNHLLNHRDASKTGAVLPAIMVGRSANVSVIGNTVHRPAGGAIYLGGTTPSTISGPYEVVGNTFTDPQDGAPLATIGQLAPSVDGIPQHVDFAFNSLASSNLNASLVMVYNGKHLRVASNRFKLPVGSSVNAIFIQGVGATGVDYLDQVDVSNNHFDIDANNGIRLSGTEALTATMRFRGNRRTTSTDMFTVSVNVTNPNIDVQDQPRTGLSLSGGVSTAKASTFGPSQTTAPTAGAGAALPATPAGYLTMNINGTDRVIPYY